jgi:RsiW-degrading membrane proteinase PrsW (M82 family)
MQTTAFVVSFLGGFIPALFWLWFWLREDRAQPEPKSLIATAFLAGMAVVAVVLPLQKYALSEFTDATLVFAWVVIEEVLKYSAALIVVLWHKTVDEPIDVIIYMITIALGFSALENALFIWSPFMDGHYIESILTGHFRFLGATLLHVLASGTVGAAMAFAFYKSKVTRIIASTIGLCVAIVLHTLFNFFIMDANGETILTVFLFVWMGIIILFLVFEKVKLLEKARAR